MKDIILLGGGGHCRSVIDTMKTSTDYNIVGILDIKEKVGTKIDSIEVVGTDDDLRYYFKQGIEEAFITLGSIGNTKPRERLYKTLKDIGYILPNIIDKTSIISTDSVIGEGSFVGKGAIINTNVIIGANCIINTGVIIEHECFIGSFTHVAPGSALSGGVKIGHSTHIGTNATIIQNITIGDECLIGAGSVVIRDIGNMTKAYGNPCRAV